MPAPYSPILGTRWGGPADCQGFESHRWVPHDLGNGSLTTAWGGTPTDGAFGYKSNAGGTGKHLKFYASGDGGDIEIPRPDKNETISGQYQFTYNPGGQSSITVASTTVVTNLNADLLDGYNTSQTSTASTVAVRDSNARLLVSAPSGSVNDEVVNYGFLYSFVAGVRDPKQACLVVYPTVLPAFTFNPGANTITADANGSINPVDGQTLAVNDRIGIVLEVTTLAKYNGIYIVTQVGSAGAPFILQRAADADTDAEVTNGLQFWVTTGTTYGDSGWLLTTADPITLNTTALTFVQNNGTAGITAGNGIVKSGNTIHAIQSSAYTTGGIVYANATTTLSLFTTAGVVQATSGGPPTAATGTQYGVAYWTSTTTIGSTSAGTSTTILHGNNAGSPTWSAISLTADVSGTLPVANGGTGATTLTGMLKGNGTSAITAVTGGTNRVTFWSDANTISSDANLTWDGSIYSIANAGGPTLRLFRSTSAQRLILSFDDTNSYIATQGGTFPIIFRINDIDKWSITSAGILQSNGAQTIQTSTGILTVTGTSGLTLTSGTSNTLLTQNSVNVFTSEGVGAIVNTLYLKAGNVGIGTTAPSTLLHVGFAGTTLGTIGLAGNTSGLVTVQPAAAAGTWTLTLPTGGGTANYALITNGSGVSSWSILPTAGGGTGRAGFYYTTTFGDGAANTFTITHSLGTRDVHVTIYATATPWQELEFAVIKHTSTTTITIELGFVPTAGEFTVVVT